MRPFSGLAALADLNFDHFESFKMEPVYELSNRGSEYIYHWFFYILAGLRYLEQPSKKVKVYMPWFKDHGFHTDSLKYFNDRFEFFFCSSDMKDCALVPFEGEPLLGSDRIAKEGYLYIREKLLAGRSFGIDPKKKVYITRRGSERLVNNAGIVHHSVLNEEALMNVLTAHGFNVVHLETLRLEEKIELFCTSNVIMAPFGGGLTFSALCKPEQTVVELVSPSMSRSMQHYRVICEELGIKYIRFTDVHYADKDHNVHLRLDMLDRLLSQFD